MSILSSPPRPRSCHRDRGHQVVQQLQEPQAQTAGCACPAPVECSRGRVQENKHQVPGASRRYPSITVASAEQKTETGSSSSGRMTRISTLSTFDCLSASLLTSARSRPVALSTKVPVAPSSSSSHHRYPSSYALSKRDSDDSLPRP